MSHGSCGGSDDGIADGSGKVDAVVKFFVEAEGVLSLAEL
jgi:hypothetical protein